MKLESLKLYFFFIRTFRNGFTLIQSIRHGGLLAHGAPIECATFWNGSKLVHPPERGGLVGILMEMFYQNVYKIGEFYEPKPGDVVVDAGAHVGVFALRLLRDYECNVVAFEPCQENFACLQENVKPFLGNRCSIYNIAIGGNRGRVRVETPESTNRSHDAILTASEGDEPGTVDIIPLEDVLELAGSPTIALLKMDIEGAEHDAFQTIDSKTLLRIERIAMEYHDNLRPGTLSLIKERLQDTHDVRCVAHGEGDCLGELFATLKGLA